MFQIKLLFLNINLNLMLKNNGRNYNNNNMFSKTFQKIINKYLKEERKKKIKIELLNNPNKIILDEIYKKKRQLKIKEMDLFRSLYIGEKIDFDTQKFFKSRPKEKEKHNVSDKKKVSKYYFLLKNSMKENEKKNLNIFFKLNKTKAMNKSLSQNLAPSIAKYNKKMKEIIINKRIKNYNNNYNNYLNDNNNNINNIRLINFPKIFPNEDKKNNLLFKTNSLLNLNSRNDDGKTLNIFYSDDENNKIQSIKTPSKTNYSLKLINNYNKNKYYKKLNSLTNKAKKISNNLSFYSKNEGDYFSVQIKTSNALKLKIDNLS